MSGSVGPNALSLSRLVLAPFMVWALLDDRAHLALVLFAAAVASDLADGPWARRRGTASAFGTALDHGADAVFVAATAGALALLGYLPLLLPLLIVAAFTQYALDARLLRATGFRPSRLGRWNGIGYYLIAGAGAFVVGHCSEICRHALLACGWLLSLTTVMSMLSRLAHVLRVRHR